jgi:hypothetical protein
MRNVKGKAGPEYVYFRAPDGFIWKLEVCLDAVERINHSTLLDGDLYVSRAERTQASSMYFMPCACPVGVSRYQRLGAEAINTLYAAAGMRAANFPRPVEWTVQQKERYMREIREKPADLTEHVVSDYADVDVKIVGPAEFRSLCGDDVVDVKVGPGVAENSFPHPRPAEWTAERMEMYRRLRKMEPAVVAPKVVNAKPAVSKTDPATEAFYQERLAAAKRLSDGMGLSADHRAFHNAACRRSFAAFESHRRKIELVEMGLLEGGSAVAREDTYSRNRYRKLIGYTERKNAKE